MIDLLIDFRRAY